MTVATSWPVRGHPGTGMKHSGTAAKYPVVGTQGWRRSLQARDKLAAKSQGLRGEMTAAATPGLCLGQSTPTGQEGTRSAEGSANPNATIVACLSYFVGSSSSSYP